MKLKSLASFATTGLLVAALGYAVPALADDTSTGQTPDATTAPTNNTDDNSQSAGSDTMTTTPSTAAPTDNSSNTGSTDEGSPDTATGDDDY